MSSTETSHTTDEPATSPPDQPAYDGSVWGASPPASVPATEALEAGSRRRFPETVRTKVASALAVAGLVVGGAAGVAIGHASGSGSTQQSPAGFGGPGTQPGQGQQGGPPGQQGQQGQGQQDGTQQNGVPGQPGTGQDQSQDGTGSAAGSTGTGQTT